MDAIMDQMTMIRGWYFFVVQNRSEMQNNNRSFPNLFPNKTMCPGGVEKKQATNQMTRNWRCELPIDHEDIPLLAKVSLPVG